MSDEEQKNAAKTGEADEDVQIIDFDKEKKDKKKKKDKKEKKDKKDKAGSDGEEDDEKKEKKKKKKDKKEKKEKDAEEDLEGDKAEKVEKEEGDSAKKEEEAKPEGEGEEEVEGIIDFADEKKKKKKKKDKGESKFEVVAEKSEKKKTKDDKEAEQKKADHANRHIDLNKVEGHEFYEYEFMLQRISDIIKAKAGDNGESSESFKLIKPSCGRSRTKSTWNNFDLQAKDLNRDHQHILEYFMSELGCEGNIGFNCEMILVGAYQAKHFLKIISMYIKDYVKCKDCLSMDTTIKREEKTRLTVLKCNKCNASRTVQQISSRFTATRRGQRRRDRM